MNENQHEIRPCQHRLRGTVRIPGQMYECQVKFYSKKLNECWIVWIERQRDVRSAFVLTLRTLSRDAFWYLKLESSTAYCATNNSLLKLANLAFCEWRAVSGGMGVWEAVGGCGGKARGSSGWFEASSPSFLLLYAFFLLVIDSVLFCHVFLIWILLLAMCAIFRLQQKDVSCTSQSRQAATPILPQSETLLLT